MTLKNTPIGNPVTGEEELYQVVKQHPIRIGDDVKTACGFVARFSHDIEENKRFIREAAEKALELRDNDCVVLKLDTSLDYNSEVAL